MGILLNVVGVLLVMSGAAVLALPATGFADPLVPTEIGIGILAIGTGVVYVAVGQAKTKAIATETTKQAHISIVTLVVLLVIFYVLRFLVLWTLYLDGFGFLILVALLLGLYGIWTFFDRKTGRSTRFPLWMYLLLILVILLLELLEILPLALVPPLIIYGIWRLFDKANRSALPSLRVFLVILLPVFLFAYHIFGILFSG
jgi:hypothetical protein